MLNEKGFTLVELLISMVILVSVVTATLQFFESYAYEKSEFGEHLTAKNLAVKALEEQRGYFLEVNDVNQTNVYQNVKRVNGINFEVKVTKEDKTSDVSILTNEVKFVKLTSVVRWKLRKIEVSAYVSEHK